MQRNKTRLGLERLDERDVPACIVGLGGPDTLVITGNGAMDTVVVSDNGAGAITGTATGWGAFAFAGIKTIKVDTGAGNDRVTYNLTRNLQPGQVRTVDVRLGDGADAFIANLYNPGTGIGSDLLFGSRLEISGRGGAGNDVMQINANRDVDVAAAATLKMMLAGETGNDVLIALYRGENDGDTSFRMLDGGAGNDTIRASLHEDLGSTGTSVGLAQGGIGDDAIGLFLITQNPPSLAILDGGAGTDVGNATANVTVINVP
jgi:hypothetical protein